MKRLIWVLLLLLGFAAPLRAEEPNLLPLSLVAHRGLTAVAPENSLAALEAAWKAGLHGAEVDVRTSADRVLLLMHDPTLERTTEGSGRVAARPWSYLAQLRLKHRGGRLSRQRIPSLKQVLAWAAARPGFRLFLDLKQVESKAVAGMVLKSGLASRVDLHVGGAKRAGMIRLIKETSRELRVSLNLGWWWRVEGLAAFIARSAGVDGLFAASWYFPDRGFGEARRAGAEVQVYLWGRKNLVARLKAAAALGAQVVSSDYPRRLLRLVRPRGKKVGRKR